MDHITLPPITLPPITLPPPPPYPTTHHESGMTMSARLTRISVIVWNCRLPNASL